MQSETKRVATAPGRSAATDFLAGGYLANLLSNSPGTLSKEPSTLDLKSQEDVLHAQLADTAKATCRNFDEQLQASMTLERKFCRGRSSCRTSRARCRSCRATAPHTTPPGVDSHATQDWALLEATRFWRAETCCLNVQRRPGTPRLRS